MLDYDAIAHRSLTPAEYAASKAIIENFRAFCPNEETLVTKTKSEMMEWCAGGGLNYRSTQRRLAWCGVVYDNVGLINPLSGITYRELDFSADLQKHYFRDEGEMLAVAFATAQEMPSRRKDSQILIPTIAALAWNGFSQEQMLKLTVGDEVNPDRKTIVFDRRTRRISQQSFNEAVLKYYELRKATADNASSLFTRQNGQPWNRLNLSEIVHGANEFARKEFGKEFLMPKLAENGLFIRTYLYKQAHSCSTEVAIQGVLSLEAAQWRNVKLQGYEHWEKYYWGSDSAAGRSAPLRTAQEIVEDMRKRMKKSE